MNTAIRMIIITALVVINLAGTGCNKGEGELLVLRTAQIANVLKAADRLEASGVHALRTEVSALSLSGEEQEIVAVARHRWDDFHRWVDGMEQSGAGEILLSVTELCDRRMDLRAVTGPYLDLMQARKTELSYMARGTLREAVALWERGDKFAADICAIDVGTDATVDADTDVTVDAVLEIISLGVMIWELVQK